MRQKILVVAGTRPEITKLAPVCLALAARPEDFEWRLAVTGQHREMVQEALGCFDLSPHYDLDVMQPEQELFHVTARILTGLDPVLRDFSPHRVVVQGDTTSTFVGALAGYYRRIPVAHVEAGLRTRDRYAPFPEEVNRRMVACIADLHFAPTESARANLLSEGIAPDSIHVTGNTIIDALRWILAHRTPDFSGVHGGALAAAAERPFVLVTCHRREIWGEPMAIAMQAVARVARENADVGFVFPVHPNPGVQQVVRETLGGLENVLLVPPLDYVRFAHLLSRARFVITDSGGVQEEAAALGKPAVVLRAVTERGEGVSAGRAILAGVDPARIHGSASRLIGDEAFYRSMAVPADLYGDGRAAERIAERLRTAFQR